MVGNALLYFIRTPCISVPETELYQPVCLCRYENNVLFFFKKENSADPAHGTTVSEFTWVSVLFSLEGLVSLVSVIHIWFFQSSASSSAEFWALRGGPDKDIPRGLINCSLHCLIVSLCICTHLLQGKTSLMVVEQETGLWVQQNVLRSLQLITICKGKICSLQLSLTGDTDNSLGQVPCPAVDNQHKKWTQE